MFNLVVPDDVNRFSGDIGGASRFFQTFNHDPFYYCAKASRAERNEGLENIPDKPGKKNLISSKVVKRGHPERGKPVWSENRNPRPIKNNHPTVKPVKLLQYLCRLVTPPGGIVLDPFMGSGSTGIAAIRERFNFVGIEMDEEYFGIADARIKNARKKRKPKLTDYI